MAPNQDNTTPTDILLTIHPFIRETIHDKILGTIFGAALGDAIGLYTEFLSKAEAAHDYPWVKSDFTKIQFKLTGTPTPWRRDAHREKFKLTSWTDDTDHALLIILSYLHNHGELLPADLAERLQVWCRHGLLCLGTPAADIGTTIQRVVSQPTYLSNPSRKAVEDWVNHDCKAAANGSLMRTHPLGVICLTRSLDETFQITSQYSCITHPDPRCVVACCISVGLIRGILRGEVTKDAHINAIITRAYQWVESWTERRAQKLGPQLESRRKLMEAAVLDEKKLMEYVFTKDLTGLKLDDPKTMGYVYKALGAAVLSLRRAISSENRVAHAFDKSSTDFRLHCFHERIQEIIMEGGDADTNACIAGALLGAWVGYAALPPAWRDGLGHRDWLLRKCEGICSVLGVTEGGYRGAKDPDTRIDGGVH